MNYRFSKIFRCFIFTIICSFLFIGCASLPQVESKHDTLWSKKEAGYKRSMEIDRDGNVMLTKPGTTIWSDVIVDHVNPMTGVVVKSEKVEKSKESDELANASMISTELGLFIVRSGLGVFGKTSVYDLNTHAILFTVDSHNVYPYLLVEDSGILLVTEGRDEKMVAYQARSGKKLWEINDTYVPPYVDFSKNGKMCFINSEEFFIIDINKGILDKKFKLDMDFIGTWYDTPFYTDPADKEGRYVYISSGSLVCIDLINGKQLWNNEDLKDTLNINFISGNRMMITGKADAKNIFFLDKSTGKALKKIDAKEPINQCFIKKDKAIAAGSDSIFTINLAEMKVEKKYGFREINESSEIILGYPVNDSIIALFSDDTVYTVDSENFNLLKKIPLGMSYSTIEVNTEISDMRNYFITGSIQYSPLNPDPALFAYYLYSIDLEQGEVNYWNVLKEHRGHGSSPCYLILSGKNVFIIMDRDGTINAYKLKIKK